MINMFPNALGTEPQGDFTMQLRDWITYEGVAVQQIGETGAYRYRTTHMALDADGSPRAYGPENRGIDANANAGYPNKGWRSVLVVDPAHTSEPYVQPAGAYAGYFVSKTSLKSAGLQTDPSTYVDSEKFPYVVFPGAFYQIAGTGRYGDLVMARRIGDLTDTAGIVADGGPTKAPLGEVSIAMAIALGGRRDPIPNPRSGAGLPTGEFEYIVFPRSAFQPAWPRTMDEIDAAARQRLAGIGGWPV